MTGKAVDEDDDEDLSEHIPARPIIYGVDKVRTIGGGIRASGLCKGGVRTSTTFVHVDTRGTNGDWTGLGLFHAP